MSKDWIGQLRIYLLQRKVFRPFCWISMEKDGSLLFAFSSKTVRLTEYGSSVVRSGHFVDNIKTATKGNLDIKDAKRPHVSFHPPKIEQKSGIAHVVDAKGTVDEWNLDWFPVRNPQAVLFVCSGDISNLDQVTRPKGNHQVVDIPNNVDCVKMELVLHPMPQPMPQSFQIANRQDVLTHIIGFCPHYIVCCNFLPMSVDVQGFHIATDSYSLITLGEQRKSA